MTLGASFMKQKSGNKSTQQFAKLAPSKRVAVEKSKPPGKPLRQSKDMQEILLPSPRTRSGKAGTGKAGTGIPAEGVTAEHVMVPKQVIKEIQAGIASLEAAFGALANALRVLE
jgi:hypothetical protein